MNQAVQEFIEIRIERETNHPEEHEGKRVNSSDFEIKTKEDYYKQKLILLRDDVRAKTRIAIALETIAGKLK